MSLKSVAIGWIAIFVVAYIGGMTLRTSETAATPAKAAAGPGYSEPLPAIGPEDAPVYVVEVTDLNCRFCAIRTGFMKRLVVEHGSQVRFVGKHLPFLKEPGSENAAVATMAAHRQDAFWRYRDHLFVHQHDNWSVEKFVSYAKTLGLDLDAFKKDLADPALRRHVRLDKAAAKALSIRATPTLFVNGRLIPPNAKPQQVRRMIRKAAAEVRGLLARGKAKTVAEARGIVAAKNHASGELFARYYMDNDVRDLIVAN